MASLKPVRCAVYTRKSSEEGLEQSFNSLHAQREACEAYVLSQKHEGWSLIPNAYDDGGFSGGSMERPGLKALMADVEAGLIDTVVVYKVDRLTRSLADFAKMVELFDSRSVSFVSVTQAFNTTTSMGRLTLNVLLSFAQFEREVTGERIRDKIAASKAKGMWMGGNVPLGYDVVDRMLVVNEPEAEQVRRLFELYLQLRSVDAVVKQAAAEHIRSKQRTNASGATSGGLRLARGSLYAILANPMYVGEIGHKDQRYPGQHEAILSRDLYDAVQALLEAQRRKRRGTTSASSAPLSGLVVDAAGQRLTATHTGKGNKRYRYYANGNLRVPAEDLEKLVASELAARLGSPAKLAATLAHIELLTPALIATAQGWAHKLGAPETVKRNAAMRELVRKVPVASAGVTIIVDAAQLGLPDDLAITIESILGRPKAKLSLVVAGTTIADPDPALIGMVAQARRWSAQIIAGQHQSFAALARSIGVTEAYVRHVIGAAFMAPDLVTRIVEGRQPRGLTAEKLKAMLPLPESWTEQRAIFATLN